MLFRKDKKLDLEFEDHGRYGGEDISAQRHPIRNILLIIIGIVVIAGGIAVYNLIRISVNPLGFGKLAGQSDGRVNILILGKGDADHAGPNLTDTVMVLSLDTASHKVATISLPRDLRVQIPGHGYGKVNTAYADGEADEVGSGAKLAEETVANTLGIPIHYYMLTDFTGLKDLVNSVGGVSITVKDELKDPEYPCDDNQYKVCGLDIKPGNYHMDGTLALQYARCRKGTCGNDFGRAARQQEVLSQIRQKVFTWQTYIDPARWTALSGAVAGSVKTDLSTDHLIQVGWMWHKIPASDTQNVVISNSGLTPFLKPGGGSDLVPIGGGFSRIQDYVQHIFD